MAPVNGRLDPVPIRMESIGKELPDIRIVVCDEHSFRTGAHAVLRRVQQRTKREGTIKLRTSAQLASNGNFSAMEFDECLGDGEAQPETLEGL